MTTPTPSAPAQRPADPSAARAGTGIAVHDGRRVQVGDSPPAALVFLERLDLIAVILVLFLSLAVYDEPLTIEYAALAVLGVIVASRAITPPDLRGVLMFGSVPPLMTMRIVVEWGTAVGVLLLAGFALKVSDWYARTVLLTWFAVTPLALIVVQAVQVRVALWLNRRGALAARFVIVGVNRVGTGLAKRMPHGDLLGFFDFRAEERIAALDPSVVHLGHCAALGDFVRARGVRSVYIALPIADTSRIRDLLSDLRNTTASVYFVPDVLGFDLIQARVVDLNGMPALAICDTPLHGTNAFAKRVMDAALAAAAIVCLAPLLAAVAIAVKATSPGPVLFRQRRYGLDGEQIIVYKFRTMTVLEDGAAVRQATAGDARVTRVGRFLRRTSIDELPQLLNVVNGTMSLVGPRPHAIAHNELYRREISGYMIRHKVRPGITGWAQVNGLRGETDTTDKMAQRVRFDLEYLSNWSLMFDLRILMRTVWVVLRGDNAY